MRSHDALTALAPLGVLVLLAALLLAPPGAAQIFSAPAVLEELEALHERGACPDQVLDGVGRTEVAGREGGSASGHYHRRTQMFGGTCDPTTFATEAQRVDEACCDADTSCTSGLPAHCDAKCAIVYNGFFGRCQGQLDDASAGTVDGYERLFETCSNLPAGALLRTATQCSGLDVCGSEPEPEPEPLDCGTTEAEALLQIKVRGKGVGTAGTRAAGPGSGAEGGTAGTRTSAGPGSGVWYSWYTCLPPGGLGTPLWTATAAKPTAPPTRTPTATAPERGARQ